MRKLFSKPSSRSKQSGPAAEAAARSLLEPLEGRVMFAVFTGLVNGQLQVNDTSVADTVALDHVGTNTIVNGASFADSSITNGIKITVGSGVGKFDTVNIRATARQVTVDGQFDIGTINIGANGSTQGVLASVTIRNINGNDEGVLTVDDSADPIGRNVNMNVVNGQASITGLANAPIFFDNRGVEDLNVKGGSGGNNFTFFNGVDGGTFGITETHLSTGTGRDTVSVRKIPDGALILINGQNGRDLVTVGNNGNTQGVVGLVEVSNSFSRSDVVVDDSADTVHRDVVIDHRFGETIDDFARTYIHGLLPGQVSYNHAQVASVTVNAGSGGNAFEVLDFGRSSTNFPTTLNTGTGADVVKVRATRDTLNINGQNGLDVVTLSSDEPPFGSMEGVRGDVNVTNAFSFTKLTLNDGVDVTGRAVVIDMPSANRVRVTGLSPGRVSYNPRDVNDVTINGGSASDTFFVRAVSGPTVKISGLGGNDLFVLGNTFNTLDPIQGRLALSGGDGFDRLTINDQGSTTAHIYSLTAFNFMRSFNSTPVVVDFLPFESIILNKGPSFGSPPLATNLSLTQNVRVGQLVTLTGKLSDADAGDRISLTVDWGDGSKPQTSRPDRTPFALTHRYAKKGNYTVRAIWTDSRGQSNFRELVLNVNP